MLTFETHNIEPALGELGEAASRYFHDRLIAPEKRCDVSVTLRLVSRVGDSEMSSHWQRLGVQRKDMVAISRDGSLVLPVKFDFMVSRDEDVLSTMLKLAHEWIHVGQVSSGRYLLFGDVGGYEAEWNGVRIGDLDMIPYGERPWEVEAHEWQHRLVEEFVDRYAKDEGVEG